MKGVTWDDDDKDVYFATSSSRIMVYKGMVQSCVLPKFYLNLKNPDFTTKFVIYDRRFSTNTSPRWLLTQPMKVIGHNEEINTLIGNVNWIRAREKAKSIADEDDPDCDIVNLVNSDVTKNIIQKCNTQDRPTMLEPLVDLGRSDSVNSD